jgi:citrate lyase gamma subunit
MDATINQSALYPLAKDIKAIDKSIKYQIHRQFGRVDRQLVNDYLKKMKLGSYTSAVDITLSMDGLRLNSDYRAVPKDILQLDATKVFSN